MKSIFASKTFWFNVAAAVVGISATVGADQLTQLGINGIAQKWVLVALGGLTTLGNIYLRTITSEGVTTPLTKNG